MRTNACKPELVQSFMTHITAVGFVEAGTQAHWDEAGGQAVDWRRGSDPFCHSLAEGEN
jgi:hypothetical protein